MTRGWSFSLDLAKRARGARDGRAGSELPIFLQIARAVVDDVRRGRLKSGDELPGSRTLAETLGVHRNTVLAAYRELAAEGWVSFEQARRTFIATDLPEAEVKLTRSPKTSSSSIGFDLPSAGDEIIATAPGAGVLSLSGGIPDVRLAPLAPLARAFRRALRHQGRGLLGYGDPRGPKRLRAAVASMLTATRAIAVTEDDLMITRGSQMGLDLLSRTLIRAGDVVAVESLGYRPAWRALLAAGAKLIPIPLDSQGMRIDALAEITKKNRVVAVYVTPHHQYPTTVVLSAGRRLELLALAAQRRFAILEDDYDHEFHYSGRPVLPLASSDRDGVVVYLGTLSKVLAPGLRIGYVVAPQPLLERLVRCRIDIDRQGDLPLEIAVAEMIEDGEVQRHTRRARRIYFERRNVLANALEKKLGGVVEFDIPAGGTALWARVDPSVDVEAWCERALTAKVAFQTARVFAFDNRAHPFARFGFAQLDPREIETATDRLARALPLPSSRKK
ncbi:MAG: PLP-dependent aminotransferase family protein [Polyangiaceae bacterium]